MQDSQVIHHSVGASRIFLFDEVYSFRAAQEQAEKKKLHAFGFMAKYNPLKRPREDTVQLVRQEMRYEPFWHILARRAIDYTCQVTYQVLVPNPHAQSIVIDGRPYDVARQKDKARIDLVVSERCHRKMEFDRLIDGLARYTSADVLQHYIKTYKFTELEQLARPGLIKPLVSMVAATQIARASLGSEAIHAFEIHTDSLEFERTYMYVRPVFAFEFRWASADKIGVIEVDGLTGEIIENGSWFKDKVNRIVTRENLFDLGAEVAGALVPGGGVAVKLINKMTESEE